MQNCQNDFNNVLYMIENLNESYSPYVQDISDFQNGIILCDLIDIIIYDKQNIELQENVIFEEDMNRQQCLENIQLALQQLILNQKYDVPLTIKLSSPSKLYEVYFINQGLKQLINNSQISRNYIQAKRHKKTRVHFQVKRIKKNVSFQKPPQMPGAETPSKSKSNIQPTLDLQSPIKSIQIMQPNNDFDSYEQNESTQFFFQNLIKPQQHPNNQENKNAKQISQQPKNIFHKKHQTENQFNKHEILEYQDENLQEISFSEDFNQDAFQYNQLNPKQGFKKVLQEEISQIDQKINQELEQQPKIKNDQKINQEQQQKINHKKSKTLNQNQIEDIQPNKQKNKFQKKEIQKLVNDIPIFTKKKSVEKQEIIQDQQNKLSKRQNSQNIVEIQSIDQKQVEKCLQFIYDLKLIKQGIINIETKLPKICKNGVIFSDIINKINKEKVIKGMNESTKNNSQINANLKKIFDYLKQTEKFNRRYLFAQQYILEGNYDVFWGIIYDLRHLYKNKTSQNDQKKNQQRSLSKQSEQIQTENYQQILKKEKIQNLENIKDQKQIQQINQIQIQQVNQIIDNDQYNATETQLDNSMMQESFNIKKNKQNCSIDINQSLNNSYQQLFIKKQKYQQSPIQNEKKFQKFDIISLEQIQQTKQWIKDLGLYKHLDQSDKYICDDTIRNGVLLTLILEKTGQINQLLKSQKYHPQNITDIENNFDNIKKVIKKRNIQIPLKITDNLNQITQGNIQILFGFCYYLKQSLEIKKQPKTFDINLPYSQQEIQDLSLTLQSWLTKLLQQSINMDNLIIYFKDGVILNQIINQIFNLDIKIKHSLPKNVQQELSNLQQSMQILRNVKKLGQKFTWMENDMQQGNQFAIFGILEDLYRFYDGLPPREHPDYFKNGPYLGNSTSYNKQIANQQKQTFQSQEIEEFKNIPKPQPFQKTRQNNFIQQEQNMSMIEKEKEQEIQLIFYLKKWLQQIKFSQQFDQIDFDEDTINELKDGVFYLSLLEKIGYIEQQNINMKPKTKAQCIQNIRILVKILEQQKNLKQSLIPDENQIFQATKKCVFDVLLMIKCLQIKRSSSKFK